MSVSVGQLPTWLSRGAIYTHGIARWNTDVVSYVVKKLEHLIIIKMGT